MHGYDNIDAIGKEADVIFTATPQGLCALFFVNEDVLNRSKIIDLTDFH